jgi:hypothetical protein
MSSTARAAPSSSAVPSPGPLAKKSAECLMRTAEKIFHSEAPKSGEGFRASSVGARSTPERARRSAPRRARWFSPRESSQMMRGTPTRW